MARRFRMITVRAGLRGLPSATSCSNVALADLWCRIALRAGMKVWARPALDASVPLPLPGLTGHGGEACQGGGLLAGHPTQLGPVHEKGRRRYRRDTRTAGQGLHASAQVRVRAGDGLHRAVDRSDLSLDPGETLSKEAPQELGSGCLQPGLRRRAVLDEPAPADQQILEFGHMFGQRRCRLEVQRDPILARTAACTRSVLATWPTASAKRRTWRGLTLANVSPPPARARSRSR